MLIVIFGTPLTATKTLAEVHERITPLDNAMQAAFNSLSRAERGILPLSRHTRPRSERPVQTTLHFERSREIQALGYRPIPKSHARPKLNANLKP